MNRIISKTILISLILVLGAALTTANSEIMVYTEIDGFYQFLKAHLIGNTLIHQHHIPIETRAAETEVTQRQTYTNLTKSENTLSFDVFAVGTHADYELDPDGKRLDETHTVSARNVSLTRYTLHQMLPNTGLSGTGRCLSHTKTELIGTTATVKLWFNQGTLEMMAHTHIPFKPNDSSEELHPLMHINMQDFWVEEQHLQSRSLSQHYSVDATGIKSQASEAITAVWREERKRNPFRLPTDSIKTREDLLIETIKKSGDKTTFLVMQEGYLYPCKVVNGILESFPLQANVQTHHDDTSFRTVFYKLLLPNEVEVSAYTMEILSGTDWKPVISFQWDNDTFHSKMDEASESKKHTLNQIRFKKLGGSP